MRIATLIPAFRLNYFVSAFMSAVRQSVKPDLIIVSDDTPNGEIANFIKSNDWIGKLKRQHIQLKVVTGPRKNSSYHNVINLCEVWNNQSDFFHFLFDDDYIFPFFYESHYRLLKENDLMVTVSRRWEGDTHGNVIGGYDIPIFIQNMQYKHMILDPKSLFQSVVPQCDNWLGEFSNSVFHKTSMDALTTAELGGYPCYGLQDTVIFLFLGTRHKLGFINEHLGFFRSHNNQQTGDLNNPEFLAAHLAWIPIAIGSEKLGFISKHDKNKVIEKIRNLVISKYQGSDPNDDVYGLLRQFLNHENKKEPFTEISFLKSWGHFVKNRTLGNSIKL
jgi:hypothetical protein